MKILRQIITIVLSGVILVGCSSNSGQKENSSEAPQDKKQGNLKDSEIQLPSHLPNIKKASYIKGKPQSFKNQNGNLRFDVKKFRKGKKDQKFTVGSKGKTLISSFRKTKDIPGSDDGLKAFLKKNIYQGNDYRKLKKSASGHVPIFVQMYKNHPVFSKNRSRNGSLRLLTKDDEITGYHQTLFNFEKSGKKKDLIEPIEAVHKIRKNEGLKYGDKVNEVEFGYMNLTRKNNGKTKRFIPTWYVWVEASKDKPDVLYFVNAVNGTVKKI